MTPKGSFRSCDSSHFKRLQHKGSQTRRSKQSSVIFVDLQIWLAKHTTNTAVSIALQLELITMSSSSDDSSAGPTEEDKKMQQMLAEWDDDKEGDVYVDSDDDDSDDEEAKAKKVALLKASAADSDDSSFSASEEEEESEEEESSEEEEESDEEDESEEEEVESEEEEEVVEEEIEEEEVVEEKPKKDKKKKDKKKDKKKSSDDDDDSVVEDDDEPIVDTLKKKAKKKKAKKKTKKITEITEDDTEEDKAMKALMANWGDDADDDDDDDEDEDEDGSSNASEREVVLEDNVLDHIVLAAPDLEKAMKDFKKRSGVELTIAGTIKGLGIKCARVSFNDSTYIEVIAPDPKSPGPIGELLKAKGIKDMVPFHYAIRSSKAEELKDEVKQFGYTPDHITMFGAKKDGSPRKWEMLYLYGHKMGGICPFFINWANSDHPCAQLPVVGKLKKFTIRAPEDDPVHELLEHVGIDNIIIETGKPKFSFQFSSPEGTVKFSASKAVGFKFPGFDDDDADDDDIALDEDMDFEVPETPDLLPVSGEDYSE